MSPCWSASGTPTCNRVEAERLDDLGAHVLTEVFDRTRARSARRAPSAPRSGGTRTRCPAPSCTATSPNRARRASRSSHCDATNGACGNPGRVQHHLLDGDDLFAVRSRTRGCTRATRRVDVDRAVADQDPHRARDDGLRRREDHVARVGQSRRRASPTRRRGRCGRARTDTTGATPASTSAWARATSAAEASSSIPSSVGSAAGLHRMTVTRRERTLSPARRVSCQGSQRHRKRRRAPTGKVVMGLDKTPDLAAIEERARQLWEETGIYRVRPRRAGRDLLGRHAAAVRLGRAPARRPRDVVRAGGVHRPLPAHARPQRLLSDGLRRQRAADRALRRAEVRRSTRPARLARSSVRSASRRPSRIARRLRAVLAQARALGRLAPAVLDDRRPLPPHLADSRSSTCIAEGTRLPLRGAGVLGSVDADVARAGGPRDDHAQLDAARHRVPRARRPRPRDLDDTTRADPELCRAVLQSRGRAVRRRSPDRHAIVPISGHEVPILSDDDVRTDFGTGLMMVCTFGDGADVQRWKRDGLDLPHGHRRRRAS